MSPDQPARPRKEVLARPAPRGSAGIWLASCALHALLLAGLSAWTVARPTGAGHDRGDHRASHALELTFRSDSDGWGGDRGAAEPDGADVLLVSSSSTMAVPEESQDAGDDEPETDESNDLDDWEESPSEGAPPGPAPVSRQPQPDDSRMRKTAPASSDREPPRRSTEARGTAAGRREIRRGVAGGAGGGSGGGTSFFEVQGSGTKFVYVIDRSVSMAHKERFHAARDELLASLAELPETAQVQVIFYNEQIDCLGTAGKPGLVRNTSAQQNKLAQFASGIVPDGGTRHLRALLAALDLAPDAIFLLTDADEPRLDAADLDRLRRANRRGVAIHAIELGVGPRLEADNFLMRVARQNRGGYRYWDIERIGSPEAAEPEEEFHETEPAERPTLLKAARRAR